MAFFKLTAGQVLFFQLNHRLIARLTCCNQSRDVRKLVNANSGIQD